jgi:acyl-CoA reductase-like NAD-dependent aldehyde dehydrogenase
VTADRWNAKNANSVNAIVAAATASEAAWQNMPTTVNELMTAAAHALEDRDTDLLEALQSHTRNWLQDDEAMLAQTYMLHTMLEAVYQLDD